MSYDTRIDIHTPTDPRALFTLLSRILGAPPGGADATEQRTHPHEVALISEPGQLHGMLSVHFNPNGALHRPGQRHLWARATYVCGNGTDPAPRHADLILRAGEWLDRHDHLWSWTNPQTGQRFRGRNRYTGIRSIFGGHYAPGPTRIHNEMLTAAHDANMRDNL